MTQWVIILVLAGVAVLCLVGARAQAQRGSYAAAEDRAPEEIRLARRIQLRSGLTMVRPFRLHGRPDHVYATAAGTVLIREDKSSQRHLEAAIIQASVYAAIVRNAPPAELRGMPVEAHAWIRIGTPGRSRIQYVRVRLLDDEALARLVDIYHALAAGWNPTRTADASLCRRRCPYFGNHCNGPLVGRRDSRELAP